jgi:hypothetical protein
MNQDTDKHIVIASFKDFDALNIEQKPSSFLVILNPKFSNGPPVILKEFEKEDEALLFAEGLNKQG